MGRHPSFAGPLDADDHERQPVDVAKPSDDRKADTDITVSLFRSHKRCDGETDAVAILTLHDVVNLVTRCPKRENGGQPVDPCHNLSAMAGAERAIETMVLVEAWGGQTG